MLATKVRSADGKPMPSRVVIGDELAYGNVCTNGHDSESIVCSSSTGQIA